MKNRLISAAIIVLLTAFVPADLIAGGPASNATLEAFKELSQARLDATKEVLQKDIQASQGKLEAQDKRIDRQDKLLDVQTGRISDISIYLAAFGIIFTFISIFAGLVGFMTIRNRAQEQAKQVAEEWFRSEGRQQIIKLTSDLEIFVVAEKERMVAAADKEMRSLQATIERKGRPDFEFGGDPSKDEDPLGRLVRQLKNKPENDYSFSDWNARAFDAFRQQKWSSAAELWLKAANSHSSARSEVATSVFNAGVALGRDRKFEKAIELYDDITGRFSTDPELSLRTHVAMAMNNKGVSLKEMARHAEALKLFVDVEERYKGSSDLPLQIQVAMAIANKATVLSTLARHEEALQVSDQVINTYKDLSPNFSTIVFRAMQEKGVQLCKLRRLEEGIATFDLAIRRYEGLADSEMAARMIDVRTNKAIALDELGKHDEAMEIYERVIREIGVPKDERSKEALVIAKNGVGFSRLVVAKSIWAQKERRIPLLQEALSIFDGIDLVGSGTAAIVKGNQAYSHFLLGDLPAASNKLREAFQIGGEEVRDAEIKDASIHPIEEDEQFVRLIQEIWSEVAKIKPA